MNRLPKMILFDYGQTLANEAAFDGVRGTTAVMRHAVRNPRGLSPEHVQRDADAINRELGRSDTNTRHQLKVEVPNSQFQACLYESLGIEFAVSHAEIERIFWDNAIQTQPTDGVEAFLNYLDASGIRTGVISNIGFSGAALRENLKRLCPTHSFEMVLASSEYLFRKPHPRIFRLALAKADLKPGDVWYCGDDLQCDVLGASACGIFPVWYTGACLSPAEPAAHPGISIGSWKELQAVLHT